MKQAFTCCLAPRAAAVEVFACAGAAVLTEARAKIEETTMDVKYMFARFYIMRVFMMIKVPVVIELT